MDAPSDYIRAKRFELVGDDGDVRGAMSVEGEDATIRLNDADGRARIFLSTSPSGASRILLASDDGTARAGIDTDPEGHPSLFLRDKDGDVRVGIDVDEDGAPVVSLGDGKRNLLQLLVADDGPRLGLFTGNGPEGTIIQLGPNGRPWVTVQDSRGGGPLLDLLTISGRNDE
jgi:hypothetical protein